MFSVYCNTSYLFFSKILSLYSRNVEGSVYNIEHCQEGEALLNDLSQSLYYIS